MLPGMSSRRPARTPYVRRTALLLSAAVLPVLLLATGCAADRPSGTPSSAVAGPTPSPPAQPSATPSSTPAAAPPLAELVLSPDGLGPLVLGRPIDPRLATFDAHACRTDENKDMASADDPIWEAWLPNYPQGPEPFWRGYPRYPFEPHHNPDGTLQWLSIRTDKISTAKGIGLLSPEADVKAAYPDADVVEENGARVYSIAGTAGRLVLEIASAEMAGDGLDAGDVWNVRVQPLDWPVGSWAHSDAGAFCAVGV